MTVKLETLRLGHYPTPVEHLETLSAVGSDLWVKRDDLTHDVYGGSKVRKLERLLAHARATRAKRIVTIGAAGSHHVLATTYFGKQEGFSVEAILVPQPKTDHALESLRASLAQGLLPIPVASWAAVPLALARSLARGATFIPVGGSNVAGAMGYVDAAHELSVQVRQGAMPEPDLCVVALGSAGTAAGLAAGFAHARMKTRVVGIHVSRPVALSRVIAAYLVRKCARRLGLQVDAERLRFDTRFLGEGYGHATIQGHEATRDAWGSGGLVLDPTYTAKAFAAALWQVRARRAPCVLYWHTLSSAPMRPLTSEPFDERTLEACIRVLFSQSTR
jgi:1-aminocyclopropane-1-carboxylate deaminase/D-cysteine desulfhydrase-like pyridoxal-dependent ACC family enzyme